jgi:zinc transporter ZupT
MIKFVYCVCLAADSFMAGLLVGVIITKGRIDRLAAVIGQGKKPAESWHQ